MFGILAETLANALSSLAGGYARALEAQRNEALRREQLQLQREEQERLRQQWREELHLRGKELEHQQQRWREEMQLRREEQEYRRQQFEKSHKLSQAQTLMGLLEQMKDFNITPTPGNLTTFALGTAHMAPLMNMANQLIGELMGGMGQAPAGGVAAPQQSPTEPKPAQAAPQSLTAPNQPFAPLPQEAIKVSGILDQVWASTQGGRNMPPEAMPVFWQAYQAWVAGDYETASKAAEQLTGLIERLPAKEEALKAAYEMYKDISGDMGAIRVASAMGINLGDLIGEIQKDPQHALNIMQAIRASMAGGEYAAYAAKGVMENADRLNPEQVSQLVDLARNVRSQDDLVAFQGRLASEVAKQATEAARKGQFDQLYGGLLKKAIELGDATPEDIQRIDQAIATKNWDELYRATGEIALRAQKRAEGETIQRQVESALSILPNLPAGMDDEQVRALLAGTFPNLPESIQDAAVGWHRAQNAESALERMSSIVDSAAKLAAKNPEAAAAYVSATVKQGLLSQEMADVANALVRKSKIDYQLQVADLIGEALKDPSRAELLLKNPELREFIGPDGVKAIEAARRRNDAAAYMQTLVEGTAGRESPAELERRVQAFKAFLRNKGYKDSDDEFKALVWYLRGALANKVWDTGAAGGKAIIDTLKGMKAIDPKDAKSKELIDVTASAIWATSRGGVTPSQARALAVALLNSLAKQGTLDDVQLQLKLAQARLADADRAYKLGRLAIDRTKLARGAKAAAAGDNKSLQQLQQALSALRLELSQCMGGSSSTSEVLKMLSQIVPKDIPARCQGIADDLQAVHESYMQALRARGLVKQQPAQPTQPTQPTQQPSPKTQLLPPIPPPPTVGGSNSGARDNRKQGDLPISPSDLFRDPFGP